jgi:hypothetical protein
MSSKSVAALRELASEVWPQLPAPMSPTVLQGWRIGDHVLDAAPDFHSLASTLSSATLRAAVESIEADPDLRELRSPPGGNQLYVFSETGGGRVTPGGLLYGIFSAAIKRLYFESSEPTVDQLSSLVLQGYGSAQRGLRGEVSVTQIVHGVTGVELPRDTRIQTPWGVMYPAPEVDSDARLMMGPSRIAPTTAILIRPRNTVYQLSREDSPSWEGDLAPHFNEGRRIEELLPLAFVMGTDAANRCAPAITFTTEIEPLVPGSSARLHSSLRRPVVNIAPDAVEGIEAWAVKLEQEHVANLHIASKRVVTAVGERFDRADALIDAVTVWESLVGTRIETSFRVTAALAKLLEPRPDHRLALKKKLSDIYKIRSRVVHGSEVSQQGIDEAATKAVDFALDALRALYDRGGDWLTLPSEDRANRLILAE